MAEYRQTYCKMWSDGWFSELELDEKLLWSYFFSNEHTSVAGIYEITLRTMTNESGIERGRVEEILLKFIQAKKCRYEDGILWVFNMPKYQGSNSPKVVARIRKDVVGLPDSLIQRDYMKLYHIDRVSIPVPESAHDTDTDTETEQDTDQETETDPRQRAVVAAAPIRSNCFAQYESNIGMLTPMIAEKLKQAEDEFPPGQIERAIGIAVEKNARNWSYIQAILERWRRDGYDGDRKNGKKQPADAARDVIDELVEEQSNGK